MVQRKNDLDATFCRALRIIAIFAVACVVILLFMHNSKAAVPSGTNMIPVWMATQNTQMVNLFLHKKAMREQPVTRQDEYVVYHLVYVNAGDNHFYHLDSFEDEESCFEAVKSTEYRDFVFEQFGDDDPKLICQSSKRRAIE